MLNVICVPHLLVRGISWAAFVHQKHPMYGSSTTGTKHKQPIVLVLTVILVISPEDLIRLYSISMLVEHSSLRCSRLNIQM